MPELLTVQLARRIAGVRVFQAAETESASATAQPADEQAATERIEAALQAERARMTAELERHKSLFSQSCQTVNAIAANLDKLYQETLAHNREDIVTLAVEIARKILKHEIGRGGYDIQAIVEEALKQAPTRQDLVIRLNPEDLTPCQQRQQENPGSPFAELKFTADWNVGRGECLVETPKGILKSFIEEHLERIGEALQKVES